MELHIGVIIRKVVYEKRIRMGDLAKSMGMHQGSISRVLDCRSLQTRMLKKFSEVLDYDFFAHYSEELKVTQKLEEASECEKQLAVTKMELEKLRQENAYLKEINELLKKH